MTEQKQPERESAISLLKIHVEWLKETSRNQLFDAHAIGEMIKEAESRSRPITPAPERECLCDRCTEGNTCHRRFGIQDNSALIQRTREEVLDVLETRRTIEEQKYCSAEDSNERQYRKGKNNALAEAISFLRSQHPATGSTTSPAKDKEGEER